MAYTVMRAVGPSAVAEHMHSPTEHARTHACVRPLSLPSTTAEARVGCACARLRACTCARALAFGAHVVGAAVRGKLPLDADSLMRLDYPPVLADKDGHTVARLAHRMHVVHDVVELAEVRPEAFDLWELNLV